MACCLMLPALGKPWLLLTPRRTESSLQLELNEETPPLIMKLYCDHSACPNINLLFNSLDILGVLWDRMLAKREFPFAPCRIPIGKSSHANPSVSMVYITSPGLRYFQSEGKFSVGGKLCFTDCSSKHTGQHTSKIQHTDFACLLLMLGTVAGFSFLQLLVFLLCWNSPTVKVGGQMDQTQGTGLHLAFASGMRVL